MRDGQEMTDMTTKDMRLNLTAIEARLVRTPISTPVRTSFGVMHDRPTLLVRVTDAAGVQGYGEVWCNFPVCGAEHRLRLIETEIAPRITGTDFASPQACYAAMTERLRILRLQTGEPGPIAQAIAGVDIAIWDMIGKRLGAPLHALLGAERSRIPAYASGINPVSQLDWEDHIPPDWVARALVWMCGAEADGYLGGEASLRDPDLRRKLGLE